MQPSTLHPQYPRGTERKEEMNSRHGAAFLWSRDTRIDLFVFFWLLNNEELFTHLGGVAENDWSYERKGKPLHQI